MHGDNDKMPRFQWKPVYETGHAEVDGQHRQLLTLANLLLEAADKGRDAAVRKEAFEALLLYTHRHFDDEETLLAMLGSPHWARHRQAHRQLAEEVRALGSEAVFGDDERLTGLEHWVETRLVPHMMEDDQEALKAAPARARAMAR